MKNWRYADDKQWQRARWYNGMDAYPDVKENDKTIVCGHWHTSYGHAHRDGNSEFGKDANFAPFQDDGILAIDGCTAWTGKVNCVVLDD